MNVLKVNGVGNWELNSIVNSIIFFREAIKKETNLDNKAKYEKRYNELKIELKECKKAA